MPRTPRIDAPGALHHVIARGIERRTVFRDDRDREAFLDRLHTLAPSTGTRLLAWALLPNHFHLLLRSDNAALSHLMQRLLGGYASAFNRRHHRHGHLFQNRFKSIRVDEEVYLLTLVRYIHLNPVRARLVTHIQDLDEYPWTGHARLLGRRPAMAQDCEFVLSHFGTRIGLARRAYRAFILDGWNEGHKPELAGGGLKRSQRGAQLLDTVRRGREGWAFDERILGSSDFVQRVAVETEEAHRATTRPLTVGQERDFLHQLVDSMATLWRVTPDAIATASKHRATAAARAAVSYIAVVHGGLKLATVARFLGVSSCTILRGVRVGEQTILDRGVSLEQLLRQARPDASRHP